MRTLTEGTRGLSSAIKSTNDPAFLNGSIRSKIHAVALIQDT